MGDDLFNEPWPGSAWPTCARLAGCPVFETGSPLTAGLVLDPAKPPTGSNVCRQKLAVLDRPYPQAVSGRPTSFAYNSTTDVFQLSFSRARAAGHARALHLTL